MKIVIENYRGWEIYFDTQKETFYAVLSEFDVDKTKQSFAAIKKSIDDYIKENVNFKPFKAIVGGWGGYTIKEFVGIRKDLRFITKRAIQLSNLAKVTKIIFMNILNYRFKL